MQLWEDVATMSPVHEATVILVPVVQLAAQLHVSEQLYMSKVHTHVYVGISACKFCDPHVNNTSPQQITVAMAMATAAQNTHGPRFSFSIRLKNAVVIFFQKKTDYFLGR